jgi:hypothetical protein
MVESRLSGRSESSTKHTLGRGSSSVLSSALAASGWASGKETSASGKIRNAAAPSKGANWANLRTSLRTNSTWMLRLPSSRGPNVRTSGCSPAPMRVQSEQLLQPLPGFAAHSRARAKASAARSLPTPEGPANR